MKSTCLVLDDLAAAEIESHVLAVQQHARRLQAPHGLPHAVVPHLLGIPVACHADGGGRHGRVLGDALEAEPVAGALRPRERGNDRQAVFRPVPAQRRAAVPVPLLHRVGHVHVKAEIGREHAIVAAQRLQVRAGLAPEPLELVIVDEEMAALAALLFVRSALRVIEALKLDGLRVGFRFWSSADLTGNQTRCD